MRDKVASLIGKGVLCRNTQTRELIGGVVYEVAGKGEYACINGKWFQTDHLSLIEELPTMAPPSVAPAAREVRVGDIVHFVLNEGEAKGSHRPAIVVHKWSPTHLNLQVFTDGEILGTTRPMQASTEGVAELEISKANDNLPNVVWKTSAGYSEEKTPGTWHWAE